MRLARSLLLAVAIGSAGGTALLVHQLVRSAAVSPRPAKPDMVEVLVAARPVPAGEVVGKEHVRWQRWPRDAIPAGSLHREKGASSANLPFEPAPARSSLLEGEPISTAKLGRVEGGSALALLLAPGMRAVSVPVREETSAGGFIQLNDRVDVIVTRRRGDGGSEAPRGEILIRGARVLAVGKTQNGKASALKTATLELAPAQASALAAAQSAGEISLSLIGAEDLAHGDVTTSALEPVAEVRVMKFGRALNRQPTQ